MTLEVAGQAVLLLHVLEAAPGLAGGQLVLLEVVGPAGGRGNNNFEASHGHGCHRNMTCPAQQMLGQGAVQGANEATIHDNTVYQRE